jgi:hypothetical protein
MPPEADTVHHFQAPNKNLFCGKSRGQNPLDSRQAKRLCHIHIGARQFIWSTEVKGTILRQNRALHLSRVGYYARYPSSRIRVWVSHTVVAALRHFSRAISSSEPWISGSSTTCCRSRATFPSIASASASFRGFPVTK